MIYKNLPSLAIKQINRLAAVGFVLGRHLANGLDVFPSSSAVWFRFTPSILVEKALSAICISSLLRRSIRRNIFRFFWKCKTYSIFFHQIVAAVHYGNTDLRLDLCPAIYSIHQFYLLSIIKTGNQ